MPVPDDVIFGPDSNDDRFEYGDVRSFPKEKQYQALKLRLDSFLMAQTGELALDEKNERKVYSPFPLFLLTCVAIESLGKVMSSPKAGTSDADTGREAFLKIAGKLDQVFSRPLSAQEKIEYDDLWGDKAHKFARSKAHVLFKFGRNSMAHCFRGKGVYLTERDRTPAWEFEDGAIIVNPYWFWRRFREVYEEEWETLFKDNEPTSARRRAANEFLDEILN